MNELEKCIGKKLKAYKVDDRNDWFRVFLQWEDDTWTCIEAEYEADWSDVTPGMGFMTKVSDDMGPA